MDRQPRLARRFFDRLEPVHAVTYFAPEARAAFDGLGFRSFWMGYFAARSAPFGVVPTGGDYHVLQLRAGNASQRHYPRRGSSPLRPTPCVFARHSAVAALRRCGVGDDDDVHTAADLAAKVARSAALDGRPLFAANRALDWPDEPVAKLWHAVTLLREQRGDGHVAVLSALGISGRECNVLHAAAGRVPKEFIMRSRDYDDEQWRLYRDRLIRRGLLDENDQLTSAGSELKQRIEDTTDMLALAALDVLADDEVETLFRSLTPITRKVVSAGDVPAATRWA